MAPKTKKTIEVPSDSDVRNAVEVDGQFRQSLVSTLQESNTARNEMKTVLHDLLRQEDTRAEIEGIIKGLDRDAIKAFWSRFGFTAWSAIIFITGVVTTVLITNALQK